MLDADYPQHSGFVCGRSREGSDIRGINYGLIVESSLRSSVIIWQTNENVDEMDTALLV